MEKNTVTISLEDYNHLRDFESEVRKGCTFLRWRGGYYGQYLTKDEAVISIMRECELLQIEIEKLKTTEKKPDLQISDIKKMSIWQFLKWRNT